MAYVFSDYNIKYPLLGKWFLEYYGTTNKNLYHFSDQPDMARCLKCRSIKDSMVLPMVLLRPGLVYVVGFRRKFEKQALFLRSCPDGGEQMKHVLIVLLCVVVGLLAGFFLSHAAISLFLPSTEALTLASDCIVLG
jgi:hypothetical protein